MLVLTILPSRSEVAATIPGAENGMIGRSDIVLRRKGKATSNGNEVFDKVKVTDLSYDPLSYVLLLPDGMDGLHL